MVSTYKKLSCNVFESVFNKFKNLKTRKLPKVESIEIQKKWMSEFASRVKEKTGKWKIGGSLWMGFYEDIEPSTKNIKAMYEYEQQPVEDFYVFDESGKHCYLVESSNFLMFFNPPEDVYVVPKSFNWTIVFRHDNAVYFSYSTAQKR